MSAPTRQAWDAVAADWIAWARTDDLDHFFWRLIRPELLGLVPAAGLLTVEVGCGEGRFARELVARGHRVLGVEGSPALAAAASAADPPLEVRVGDAAELPIADGAADLVVASMSLLNIDDLDGAVAEVARVLGPGGRFCFATVHPANSVGAALEHARPFGGYFAQMPFAETRERGGLRMTFHDIHRPLRAFFAALEAAGLLVEAVREPVPDDEHVAAHPSAARWRQQPGFLLVRALKP